MTNGYGRAGIITSALVFAISAPAAAAPITLTQTYSDDGRTISGTLHGDRAGDVITLNNSAPLSTLSIALPDPDPQAIPVTDLPNTCAVYSCTSKMYLNTPLIGSWDSWNFDITGNIALGTQTGALTGTPTGEGSIGTASATMKPTFSVTTDQIYGPIQQQLANAQAAAINTALNTANVTVTFDGSGVWHSVDLPNMSAVLSEDSDTSEFDFRIIDALLKGRFIYDVGITFDNAIVNIVGNTFFTILRDQIYDIFDDALIGFFSLEEPNFRCDPSRISRGNIGVECTVSTNFLWTDAFPQSPRLVSAPAMTGLFGLGLLGLVAVRRRRTFIPH